MNLNQLFAAHKGDRSYDDLERACGKALTSQRLQQIATTKPKEFPKANAIRALAQALGVREVVVVLAAAESLDLDASTEMPRVVQLLPATASSLTDEQVASIGHVIRAFAAEEAPNREQAEDEQQQPDEPKASVTAIKPRRPRNDPPATKRKSARPETD